MSREIKFRFWDKRNQRWSDDFLYIDSDGDLYEIYEASQAYQTYMYRECVNDRYERVQFTGLKDKNGVDVYDGDIYRNLDSGLVGKLTITWGAGGDYVRCTEYKDGRTYNNLPFAELDTTNFEVIGNIYQNSDLLAERGE